MKIKSILLAITLTLSLTSCCSDDIEQPTQVESQQTTLSKTIQFDTEDNMIKVDGCWYHNSNNDQNNWQYLSEYGFRWHEGFLWLHYNTDQYELVNAEMVNFPYAFYLSTDGDGKYYIESPYFDQYYVERGDQYFIKLTLRKK